MSFPTLGDICEALNTRTADVAETYAPGGHVDKGKYWALNPGRADSKVGSFYVNLTGNYAGRFMDHASGDQGDMLDLIQLALNCDRPTALAEARQFLGMDAETEDQRQLRLRQQQAAKARRQQAEIDAVAKAKEKQGHAHAMFISAQPKLEGTPVANYLAGRAIGLEDLARQPGAIRYLPKCNYFHTDKETGEYIEGEYPAMISAIYGPAVDGKSPEFFGVHRTYLAKDEAGNWRKAPVPDPKKVFGRMKAGYIRLWTGTGPRGGKAVPLSRAPEGDHVYITEGIEDGLSMAVIKPDARVLVAISLGNIKEMILPAAIKRITIVADNDDGPEQLRLIEQAIANFTNQGRVVAKWQNRHGGKDLNDALIRAKQQESAGAA